MPEVPDLKNYIRRVSGSAGSSDDGVYLNQMFSHDLNTYYLVKAGGLTSQGVEDLGNAYIERLSEIKDTFVPVEGGPQTPEDQAMVDTYSGVVLSPGYAMMKIHDRITELENLFKGQDK